MAVEYHLESDTAASRDDLSAFLATAVGGRASPDGTVFRPGMYVMTHHTDPEDEDLMIEAFGFTHRLSATYRFDNLATPDVQDHNTALMVRSVIAFAGQFGGRGVLLFNGDRATIQWNEDGIVFDSEWEEWTDVAAVVPLIEGHTMRLLPQPLL